MQTPSRIYQLKVLICSIFVIFFSVVSMSCASKKNASTSTPAPSGSTVDNSNQSKTKETAKPDEKIKQYQTHQVQEGETISIIAKKYNVTVDAIVKLNNIADVNFIRVGQKLMIPETEK